MRRQELIASLEGERHDILRELAETERALDGERGWEAVMLRQAVADMRHRLAVFIAELDSLKPHEPVRVPSGVLDGLEQIRRGGRVNMLDRVRVQSLAADMDLPEVALWIEENQSEYARGIFQGFEPRPDKPDDDVSEAL